MKPFDLVIKGGDAVLPGRGRTVCDIAIHDGKIAAILAPGGAVPAQEELLARGLVVMPGAVDVHLHLGHGKDIARPREPLDADRETAAAAKGGVTTFIPYLMATEPFEAIFDDVVGVTEQGARVDFGYHFIISTEAQLAGVARYVRDYGAPSFKIFMNNRGGEGRPPRAARHRRRLSVPAVRGGGSQWRHGLSASGNDRNRLGVARSVESERPGRPRRPENLERNPPAVRRSRRGAARSLRGAHGGCPTLRRPHFVGRSPGGSASPSPRRPQVHIETCPHYLTHDIGWPGADVGKINPPLRQAVDRDRLWQGLRDGQIDTVATDHVHRDISAKAGGIWTASPGCPGLETLLPVLLSEGHHKRGLPLERIVEVVATNPARIMGLGHAKGSIAPGLDADLALVDLEAEWTLQRGDVVSSAGYSIYEGQRFKGRVRHALVRGRPVLRDDALVDAAVGHGRYVRRRLPS
jgi:dihydropyrimidinase